MADGLETYDPIVQTAADMAANPPPAGDYRLGLNSDANNWPHLVDSSGELHPLGAGGVFNSGANSKSDAQGDTGNIDMGLIRTGLFIGQDLTLTVGDAPAGLDFNSGIPFSISTTETQFNLPYAVGASTAIGDHILKLVFTAANGLVWKQQFVFTVTS